jgi:ubiquinone/menaquinone biosynthesis C-methylase UbiE
MPLLLETVGSLRRETLPMEDSEPTERNGRPTYILRESGDQYRRLVRMAQQYAVDAKDALRRARIGGGARVIDVGCGPIGSLLAMVDTVGSTGLVVGLDTSSDALRTAKAIVGQKDIANVTLVCADINSIEKSDLCPPGPFDAAYCRLVLVHQTDPVETLKRMASIVRPGGYIIAQEWLYDPGYPIFDPPVPEMEHVERLLGDAMRLSGASLEAARFFTENCSAAGLQEVSQRAFLEAGPANANIFLEYQAVGTLRAAKLSLAEYGLASEEDIEGILESLERAAQGTYRSFFGLPFVELIARVP